MKEHQDNIQQDQQDLKQHTLNRLDALDEKMEWFLSKGQQGAHPLSDTISQIKGQLEDQRSMLSAIKESLGPHINEKLSQIEARLDRQSTSLDWMVDNWCTDSSVSL